MSVFENIEIIDHPVAHGEVNFFRIKPKSLGWIGEPEFHTDGSIIIGHSEQGHHHLMEAENVTIKSRSYDAMQVLHAIVRAPTRIYQDVAHPHDAIIIEPGEYIVMPARSFDPLSQQARLVSD